MSKTMTNRNHNILKVDGKTIRLHGTFSNRTMAESWTERAYESGHPLWIVLGDNSKFWCVRPVDAGRLERAGYELV